MAQIELPDQLGIAAMSSPEYVIPTQFVHRSLGGKRYVATLDDGAGLYMGRIVFAGFQQGVGGRLPTVGQRSDLVLQHGLNYMSNRLNDVRNFLRLPLLVGDRVDGEDTYPVVNTPTATALGTPEVASHTFDADARVYHITLTAAATLAVGQFVTADSTSMHRLLQVVTRISSTQYVFAPSLPLAEGTRIQRATDVHVEKLQVPTLSAADIQALVAGEVQPGGVFNWIERI